MKPHTQLRRIARVLIASMLTVAGLACPLRAIAQQAPANVPAVAGASTYTATMVRNAVEVRDSRTGVALVAPTHHPMLTGFGAGITSATTFQTQPDGVDVIVTLTNGASTPQEMGSLQFGIFNMGEQIDYLWSRMNTEMRPASARSHIGQAWLYPLDLYAPVMVMRNQQKAVGVSILYPVMEYQHDVRVTMASPGNWAEQGEAGRGWFVTFDFRNFGRESDYTRLRHTGSMNPGETRTYVVTIRETQTPSEWIRTLLPYRDYFRATHGAVRYQRETTPVRGFNVADPSHLSSANPLGFAPHLRPDLRGFGPTVRNVSTGNWDEVMFWTPTGLYNQHRNLNWPWHFASTLDDRPGLDTAFSNTDGFPWLAAQGTRVGFWWGRSVEYVPSWDNASSAPFDPSIPAHLASALDEIDTAVRAGATVIGLDTFTPEFLPLWRLIPWLDTMKQRHPNVRFVTEPSQCDILHLHAATWYDGWNDISTTTTNRDDLFTIKGPNLLADFLAPGSESWVGLGYRPAYLRSFPRPSTAQVVNDMRRHADWGFRPVIAFEMNEPTGVDAAPSWETSLPADIRDSDPFIQNIRAGRLPGQAAPPPPQPLPTPDSPPNPTGNTPNDPSPNPSPNPNPSPTPPGNGGNDPNGVIVVVPNTPPPPDGRTVSNQYSGSGGSTSNPPVAIPPSNGGSPIANSGSNSGSNATSSPQAGPRVSWGTSRRRNAAPVVLPATQRSRTSVNPRPSPMNGAVTPTNLNPPNVNRSVSAAQASQPRVSLPSTSAAAASNAMRRSTQPAATNRSGTSRRKMAPATNSVSSGVHATSNTAASRTSSQGTQTITNQPTNQPTQPDQPNQQGQQNQP